MVRTCAAALKRADQLNAGTVPVGSTYPDLETDHEKATHTGTCQVCGHEQALPGGELSKHGYDVTFHYFRGVCPGASHLPLEQDRKLADEVAASLLITSRNVGEKAAAVARGKLLPTRAKTGRMVRIDGRTRDELVPFAEAPLRYQQGAVAALQHSLESESRECARVSKGITDRADKITGQQALKPRDAGLAQGAPARHRVHPARRPARGARIEDRTCFGVGPHSTAT